MKLIYRLFILSGSLLAYLSCYSVQPHIKAFVPNDTTAIKIAEAIWLPIYGESIFKEKPYKAYLVGDSVWVVTGTLHMNINGIDIVRDTTINGVLHVVRGGVLYAEIRKSDSKILKVTHGK